MTFGLTEEQNLVIENSLPVKNSEIYRVDYATDIIAVSASVVIIKADMLDCFFTDFVALDLTIYHSVQKIGKNAFDSCSSLSSIKLPDTIREIEDETFSYCSRLKSINIPDSVKK